MAVPNEVLRACGRYKQKAEGTLLIQNRIDGGRPVSQAEIDEYMEGVYESRSIVQGMADRGSAYASQCLRATIFVVPSPGS